MFSTTRFKTTLLTTALLFTSATTLAAVVGKEVEYSSGGVTMKGYIAYDDAITTPRPGVLVVHEWWGHTPYARQRADQLAQMGYTALAVDMFGDGKTANHPKEAGEFSSAVKKNLPMMKARFEAALATLQHHAMVNKEQTAAIGYCFGGGVVLEMARQGADLDAVASFHGSLDSDTPVTAGSMKAAVLVANGGADKMVKPESIARFNSDMATAGADYRFINYAGVLHSFTNPDATELGQKFGMPVAYNAAADRDSWAELDRFLKQQFSHQ